MGVLMLFSYFDKIFRLVGFGFHFDDFQFWADGEWRMHFPRHFCGFGNKYKTSVDNLTFCYIQMFKIIKKSEGHFPSGHNYMTNYIITNVYNSTEMTNCTIQI